jgi:hypothetical protein
MKNDINVMNISNARIIGAYSCDAYGAGAYNSTSSCTTTTGASSGLADTGYNILLPAALGLALIIAAAILIVKRIVRRRASHNS